MAAAAAAGRPGARPLAATLTSTTTSTSFAGSGSSSSTSSSRRRVLCRDQANRFRQSFDPAQTRLPPELWLAKPEGDAGMAVAVSAVDAGPLTPDTAKALRVANSVAQQPGATRGLNPFAEMSVRPSALPGGGGAAAATPSPLPLPLRPVQALLSQLFPRDSYAEVTLKRDYTRELPSLATVEGKTVFRPGVLQWFYDPYAAPVFVAAALVRTQRTPLQRAIQVAAAAAYLAAAAAAFSLLWRLDPLGAAAIYVTWLANRLTPLLAALLVGMMWWGNAWVYVAFVAFRWLDARFEQYVSPVRTALYVPLAAAALFALFVAVWPELADFIYRPLAKAAKALTPKIRL